MIYQVWLHARHPKTLETVATVRVYAHDDRLRAEAVLEHAQADFQPLVLELLRAHPGALVNAEMRQEIDVRNCNASNFDPRNNAHQYAVLQLLISALRHNAAFDDERASQLLANTGSYGWFDEPGAAETAREALAQIGITQ